MNLTLRPRCPNLRFVTNRKNRLSSTFMAMSDDWLSATVKTDSQTELWTELKEKYDILAKATIDALLTDYHVLKMRDDVSMCNYVDRLTYM